MAQLAALAATVEVPPQAKELFGQLKAYAPASVAFSPLVAIFGWMFCLSLFDKHWKPKMNREEASDLVDKCIAEVRERLVTAPTKYHVKIVDASGTSVELYDCEEKFAERAVAKARAAP